MFFFAKAISAAHQRRVQAGSLFLDQDIFKHHTKLRIEECPGFINTRHTKIRDIVILSRTSSVVHVCELPKLRLLCPIPSYESTFCCTFPRLAPTGRPAGRKWYCLLFSILQEQVSHLPLSFLLSPPSFAHARSLRSFHSIHMEALSHARQIHVHTERARESERERERARERERDCFRYRIGCVSVRVFTLERYSSRWLALCLEGFPWRKGTLPTPWRAWTINWGQKVRPPVATCCVCEGCGSVAGEGMFRRQVCGITVWKLTRQ